MIEFQISLKKKIMPLTVQTKEGAVARKTGLILFHMKGLRVRTQGEVNSLYSLSYLQIQYYKHYNKMKFDVPEIHDTGL